METIGIIAAMSQESDAILRFIEGWKPAELGAFRSQRFRLCGRDCWLVKSGMGLARAGQAARVLLDAIHPQLLVSVGVAGAVHDDLEIGDVVVSSNTCLLDHGLPGPFQPLAHLSNAAWQAASQALQSRRAHLVSGIAVTTRGSQSIQHEPGEMINPVLEMETVEIAQVASEQAVPLLSLRAVSDGLRAPIPFDLEAVMDEEYNLRIGEIIKVILGHPQMIPQFVRMGRNTTRAAENVAIALIAALSLPGPVIST